MTTSTMRDRAKERQANGPSVLGRSDTDLNFQLATIRSQAHPELLTTRMRHEQEMADVKTPLLAALVCKDKLDEEELLCVQRRVLAARVALQQSRGTLVEFEETLKEFEDEEITRRMQAQHKNRFKRVTGVRKLLEVIQFVKDLEYAELQDLMESNAVFELRLRKVEGMHRRRHVQEIDTETKKKKKNTEAVKKMKEQVHQLAESHNKSYREAAMSGMKL